jgi:hypothetical protein
MGFIKKLFSPAVPKLPPPVTTPTREKSAAEISAAAEDDKQRRASQAGRASTILSKGQGALGDDTTGLATKKLLGGG